MNIKNGHLAGLCPAFCRPINVHRSKIKKTDNIFEAIDAAFKAYPEWSKTDDIRFNAVCKLCDTCE